MSVPKMRDCPDCGTPPGECHHDGCGVERCSTCGGQRLQCECMGHDPCFSRWNGFWPGGLEAAALGMDLNALAATGFDKLFFVKPTRVA